MAIAFQRFILALASLMLVFHAAGAGLTIDLRGSWKGAIKAPGQSIEIQIDFDGADGAWSGDISIPIQRAADLPLADVKLDGTTLTWKLPGVPGDPAFQGTLAADGMTIDGTFTQGGFPMECDLTRTDAPGADPAAPLEGFDAWVEKTLADWRAPGAAIAIVRDGKPIFVKGYGIRDAAANEKVDENTLFAIGSSTKAFTTFVMESLAQEQRLDWDKPVRTWMPEFALRDADVSARITPRDLVTHRSGLPRHDAMWYNSDASREDIVRRVRFLESNKDFRTDFQYNNLMFVSAGRLIERVTGSTWEDEVRSRVFKPLGMARSQFNWGDAESVGNVARGYEWRDDAVKLMKYRDIPQVGPAGSILSSAHDLVPWLIVHTSGGKLDGKAVLPPAAISNLHTPAMAVPGALGGNQPEIVNIGYGLGWFADVYRGHRRIHHGGNIDGFSALVAFLPQSKLGVAVLVNMNSSSVPDLVVREVTDRVLKLEKTDWSAAGLVLRNMAETAVKAGSENEKATRRAGTSPSHVITEYAGEFVNDGYGTLVIRENSGSLSATYNRINTPLEHWHFDIFVGAKVKEGDHAAESLRFSFASGLDGYIDAVNVLMEGTVPPIRFTRVPDASLSEESYLARFAGEYEVAGTIVTVSAANGSLHVAATGQPPERLIALRTNFFTLEAAKGVVNIEFATNAAGEVTGATFSQPGVAMPMTRKPAAK